MVTAVERRASAFPGGLKPGLGPLRGRVLKDMTWDASFKTSRGAFARSMGAALPQETVGLCL